MNASRFTAIGVDVGGTKIAAGVVTFPEGLVSLRRTVPTRPQRGGAAVLAEVESLVSGLAAESLAAGRRANGIGVGVCEIVDRAGHIVSAHCLDWPGALVSERLANLAPAVVEADVRAAARAEALFGAGRAVPVFLYVSIGTGIASCLVLDGEPFTGARGATGTMASGPLPGFDEHRRGTPRSTLEQIAAGPALVTRFNQLHGEAQSGQDVLAAAAAGDDRAIQVVDSAAETLGGSIGWLINVLDPQRVVLGGGLGVCAGPYRDRVIASAHRHVWWEGHRAIPILPAQTGADAGLIGAAATAWGRYGRA